MAGFQRFDVEPAAGFDVAYPGGRRQRRMRRQQRGFESPDRAAIDDAIPLDAETYEFFPRFFCLAVAVEPEGQVEQTITAALDILTTATGL